jgi:hypothetical protein
MSGSILGDLSNNRLTEGILNRKENKKWWNGRTLQKLTVVLARVNGRTFVDNVLRAVRSGSPRHAVTLVTLLVRPASGAVLARLRLAN